MSDKEVVVDRTKQARELTTRIEGHDTAANKELLDLQNKMSPKEYGNLLRTIQATNMQDRESNPKLPELLIMGKEPKFVGVDYAPIKKPVAEVPKQAAAPAEKGATERGYSNTALGIERMWNDFFGRPGK